MALEGPSLAARLFYALYEPRKSSQYKAVYAEPPEQWHPDLHPLFGEPEPTDELSVWSKHMYGTETLSRVLLARHPARDTSIRLFSLTKSDYTVPQVQNNLSATVIERVLAHKLRPFILEGKGKVLCPICLFRVEKERVEPVLLSRNDYVEHFSAEHSRNAHVQSLAFATGLHTRHFEAAALYFAVVFLGAHGDDHSDDHPFDESPPPFVKLGTDDCLKNFVLGLTQDQLKSKKLRSEPDVIVDSPPTDSPLAGSTKKARGKGKGSSRQSAKAAATAAAAALLDEPDDEEFVNAE
jgi:hypothetical protein